MLGAQYLIIHIGHRNGIVRGGGSGGGV
jgi:hypothetical protein